MIPIYAQEIKDNIAEQVQANASIAIASALRIVDQTEAARNEFLMTYAKEANPNQFDLFYIEAVLVSTGWNKNWDVFDRFEAWRARSTPVDKQFNYMHNEKDIIGHITSSRVVNPDLGIIADNTPFDSVPSNFDIVVGSVIYKIWSDSELQNRMNSIIEGISKGRWFVSMECLFRNFDYAIITPTGEHKVLARNEETAFLTKYLRQYGGTGEYEGHKVGRLLRDFGFSGKGLVDKPANERSLILNFDENREVTSFSVSKIENRFLNKEETRLMANEETVSKVQYDELKAEFDKAKASIDEQNSKKVAELESTVASLKSELGAGKEVMLAKDEQIAELKNSLSATQAALDSVKAEINTMRLEAVKAGRLASLLTKQIAEDRAKDLVEKFVSASDEMFTALLDSLPVKEEAKCDPGKEKDAEAECGDEEEKEEMKKSECSEDDKTNAETANLENVQANDDVNLNVSSQEVENVAAKAAAWFSQNILKTTAKLKKE